MVRNQFTEYKSISDLSILIKEAFKEININASIKNIENPRVEQTSHYYNPNNKSFIQQGLNPKKINKDILLDMINYIKPYAERIDKKSLMPNIKWNNKN